MLGKRSSPEKIKDQETHSDDRHQDMAASQEVDQSDGPGFISPFKKQRPDEIPQKNTINSDDKEEWYPSFESYCLSKTITSSDLNPESSRLHLNVSEAITLADDPDIIYHPAYRYKKNLTVVDVEKRRYDMQLTNYIGDKSVKHWAGGDWEAFVRNHNLKAGDEITFYKLETGGFAIKVGRSEEVAVEKKEF